MSDSGEDLLSVWLNRSGAVSADCILPRADRAHPLQASYAQQGMWLADIIAADADKSSVVQHAWRLLGSLDIAALHRAFDALAARHEAWRTGFEERGGALFQVIFPCTRFDFAVEALPSEDAAVLERRIIEIYRQPMDLTAGQVARARIFVVAPEHHVLLVTIHHIAFDGWSLDVLQREIQALYAAALLVPAQAGVEDLVEASDLPAFAVQYPDFAVWQRTHVEQGRCADSLAYWSGYLAGVPELLMLPADKPLPSARSSAGDRIALQLPTDLNDAVQVRATELVTTAFCLQLVAFMLTIAKWTGQHDFVLGITLAGRKEPEVEMLLGFFVNVLPIRCELDAAESVRDVVARVHGDLLRIHDHDDVPLEYLLRHLGVARSATYKPLVQVTVASHQNLTRSLELDGLDVAYLPPVNLDVQEDLTLFFTSGEDRVDAHFAFSTDLFHRDTIAAQSRQFVATLERICREPALSVGDLGIDTSARRDAAVAASAPALAEPVDAEDGMQSEIEAAMLEIWCEVLANAPADRDANFFALGGTSLSALRVCNRASALFGVRVPVRKLFEKSTVRGLSAIVGDLLRCAAAAS